MAALRYCYGDSTWVDLDRIWAEIQDPATHEAEARRFYLNQIVAGDEQWIPKAQWDACALHDVPIEPGEEITLGFDGGIRDDSTALVAVRVRDGLVFPIKIWERPYGDLDWEVDVLDVDAWLRKIYGRFKVVRMNCDPAYWQDIVGRWSLEYPETVWEWWTNRPTAMAKAVERFETAVATKALRHASDPTLTRHVMNTKVEETAWGRKLKKDAKGGSRKIDGAIAAILAYEARAEYLTDPPPPEGIVFGF
jgi:phage terminase large subunit-like protein